MMLSNEKEYLLDGDPITPGELIQQASARDKEYDLSWLKSTSESASILRQSGFTVERNPDVYRAVKVGGNEKSPA